MASDRKCPSCGAEVAFRSSIELYAVCEHCRSLVRKTELDLELLGRVAQLQPDGSPLQLRATGLYKDRSFEIVGRVQLSTPRGFWNEWALAFSDGGSGWIGEAQGTYAVNFRADQKGLPSLDALKLGAKVHIQERNYVVREIIQARYLAAEGGLPFKPPLGETAPSADLISPGGFFATLDYSEGEPIAFVGEYQGYDDLRFKGVRAFEGWAS